MIVAVAANTKVLTFNDGIVGAQRVLRKLQQKFCSFDLLQFASVVVFATFVAS